MSNIKTRLHNARSKLLRRGSATSTTTRSASAGSDSAPTHAPACPQSQSHSQPARAVRQSISLSKLTTTVPEEAIDDSLADQRLVKSDILGTAPPAPRSPPGRPKPASHSRSSTNTSIVPVVGPAVTLEEPTPIHPPAVQPAELARRVPDSSCSPSSAAPTDRSEAEHTTATSISPAPVRRQSVVANTDERLIKTLLAPEPPNAALPASPPATADYFGPRPTDITAAMLHRKIWVKRPGASATQVQISESDLVDDVRDMILKKYANSLGRSFDSPDVTLRIVPRDAQKGQDRTLGPEEEMCRTLDAYYPDGQKVADALLIDVPHKRTPRASPRINHYYSHHDDATNHHTEYFPPMPIVNPSPSAMSGSQLHDVRVPLQHAPHSISVLNTGQLPPLPSPGGNRRGTMTMHGRRPVYARHNTASPTILAGGIPSSATSTRPPGRPRQGSEASEAKNSAASNNPIPTPPATDEIIPRQQTSNPSTPRISSPKPVKRRKKKTLLETPSLPAGLLDGSVPPINVLIVEDNIINLRILEAFMQRLKVRWQRALNGKEALNKWKAGGFHLVLMDIQLPIMNGLEATREIRRLERANGIGIFTNDDNEDPSKKSGEQGKPQDELSEDDRLGDKSLFKSSVIIVALTASNLQSDRHEALAAGCNDFLTKPVNFVWLERKVKEWGCMQALIDFDGWRQWKDFADKSGIDDKSSKLSTSFASIAPSKKDKSSSPKLPANRSETNGVKKDDETKDKDRDRKAKRKSMGTVLPPPLVEESETPPPEMIGATS